MSLFDCHDCEAGLFHRDRADAHEQRTGHSVEEWSGPIEAPDARPPPDARHYQGLARIITTPCPNPGCPTPRSRDTSPVVRSDGLYAECGGCGRIFKP